MKAVLVLENRKVWEGKLLGKKGTTVGEVIFNTSMTGYQEILTDPSYKGQIITMTYPEIGNYGINEEDVESSEIWAQGFIIKENWQVPSNFRAKNTLDDFLKSHNVVGISNIDTRKLTKVIRNYGSLKGIISSETDDIGQLTKTLKAYPDIVGRDLVQYVTCKEPYRWKEGLWTAYRGFKNTSNIKERKKIAVYDFGIKKNILRHLWNVGFDVYVFPAYTKWEEVKKQKVDAILLSNGPGDPNSIGQKYIENLKELVLHFPTMGICFGHQIIARVFNIKILKMKFGHHGGNQPVKDIKTGKIDITAQNHNYAIDEKDAMKKGFETTHINLNDGTVEGMKHKNLPIFSVQYHPENSPGPHDTQTLFNKFYAMVEERSNK